jgi:hypothetical protein
MHHFTTALVTTAALATAGVASANIIVNGSFEDDALGVVAAPSGGFDAFNGVKPFQVQSGLTATIVDSNVTDGSQALELSGTVNNGGFYDGLNVTLLGFETGGTFELGTEYRVTGDVTYTGGPTVGDEFSVADANLQLIEYDDTGFGFGNAMTYAAGANFDNPTNSLDAVFTYRGGAVTIQGQLQSFGNGDDQLSAVFDNLSITVVPEPTSAAAIGLIGLVGLRRRR